MPSIKDKIELIREGINNDEDLESIKARALVLTELLETVDNLFDLSQEKIEVLENKSDAYCEVGKGLIHMLRCTKEVLDACGVDVLQHISTYDDAVNAAEKVFDHKY